MLSRSCSHESSVSRTTAYGALDDAVGGAIHIANVAEEHWDAAALLKHRYYGDRGIFQLIHQRR